MNQTQVYLQCLPNLIVLMLKFFQSLACCIGQFSVTLIKYLKEVRLVFERVLFWVTVGEVEGLGTHVVMVFLLPESRGGTECYMVRGKIHVFLYLCGLHLLIKTPRFSSGGSTLTI